MSKTKFFQAAYAQFCFNLQKRYFMIYTLLFILNILTPQTRQVTISSQKSENSLTWSKDTKADVNIAGFWEGTISRDEGYGKRVMFEMEVILSQNGKNITGISIVRAKDGNRVYSAKMDLVGKIKNSYFKYSETQIVSSDVIPEAEWCVKKVELIYKTGKNNEPTLEGMWEGITGGKRACIPGRVLLKRKPPRV